MLQKSIKVTLAVLFFICLAKMPYGYFQLVRFVALLGFTTLAYNANKEENKTEAIIYIVLTILFQPFFKISFGREIWNIIDVIVGIGLIVSIFIKKETSIKN